MIGEKVIERNQCRNDNSAETAPESRGPCSASLALKQVQRYSQAGILTCIKRVSSTYVFSYFYLEASCLICRSPSDILEISSLLYMSDKCYK